MIESSCQDHDERVVRVIKQVEMTSPNLVKREDAHADNKQQPAQLHEGHCEVIGVEI